MCRAGASWVQENVLELNPDADIEVFAVWFEVLATDSRAGWDPDLLFDPRVTHLWDNETETGLWFGRNGGAAGLGFTPQLAWDIILLYEAGAEWGDAPTPLLGFAAPVIAARNLLDEELSVLLAR